MRVCLEGVPGGCAWRVRLEGVSGGCVWRVCLEGDVPQSYWMSLRSGKWVLMLHWMRCRLCESGATWEASMEVKTARLWLRDGGGWQECMEIGGASTGGMTNANLERIGDRKKQNIIIITMSHVLINNVLP